LQLVRSLRKSAAERGERALAEAAADVCRSVLADPAEEDDGAETDGFRAELARSLLGLAASGEAAVLAEAATAFEEAIAAASPGLPAVARARLRIAAAEARLALATSRRAGPERLRAFATAAEEALAGLAGADPGGLAWRIEARRALALFELDRGGPKDELARSLALVSKLAEDARGLADPPARAALLVALARLSLRRAHLGTSTDGELEAAARALAEGLEIRTRELEPLAWAEAQQLRGEVFMLRGQRPDGLVHLEAAVAAFREALKERTRARGAAALAETHVALGRALAQWGGRTRDAAAVRAAPLHLMQALREVRREANPQHWAQVQTALGYAHRNVGEQLGRGRRAARGDRRLRRGRDGARAPDPSAGVEDERQRARAEPAHARRACARRGGDRAGRGRVPGRRGDAPARDRRAGLGGGAAQPGADARRAGRGWARDGAAARGTLVAFEAALSERRRERAPAPWAATRAALATACELFVELAAGPTEGPAALPAPPPKA
jgi:hypothetical protein